MAFNHRPVQHALQWLVDFAVGSNSQARSARIAGSRTAPALYQKQQAAPDQSMRLPEYSAAVSVAVCHVNGRVTVDGAAQDGTVSGGRGSRGPSAHCAYAGALVGGHRTRRR